MRLRDPVATQLRDHVDYLQSLPPAETGPGPAQWQEIRNNLAECATFLTAFVIEKTIVRDVDGSPRAEIVSRPRRSALELSEPISFAAAPLNGAEP